MTASFDEKYLFVAMQIGGVFIYNIQDPENLRFVNSTLLPYNNFAANIKVLRSGIFALVTANSGVIVLYIKEIQFPTVVGFTPISNMQFFDIIFTKNEEFAYVCAEQTGTVVLDLRKIYITAPPITLDIVGIVDTAVYGNIRVRLSPDEKTLFVLDLYYGLMVVDVSDI